MAIFPSRCWSRHRASTIAFRRPQERRAPPPPIEDDLEFEEEAEEEARPARSYGNLIKGAVAALVFIVVGGLLLWQWPNMVALYSSFRAPAVETVRETPPPANTRPKITDRIEPGTQQAPATPAPGVVPGAGAAQKVVLYEEDPADPNGKRFVGSAIWRTETVTPGPGQPPELAIRADVEVPERKLAMTFSFRRNTDKGLPATHTVEITSAAGGLSAGGISNVPGILMKQAESTRGVPLAGLAVKVTPGFYLVGLSNQEADKDRNLQLLKERLVRHPGGLQQQPPRHHRPGKRAARRPRLRGGFQDLEAVGRRARSSAPARRA